MRKIVKITLLSVVSLLLLSGCHMKSVHPDASMSGGYETPIPLNIKKKQLHHAIMEAGESNGWVMTDFKENSIIAEKIEGDKSATAVISFAQDKIVIMKDSSTLGSKYDSDVEDLQDAIQQELH